MFKRLIDWFRSLWTDTVTPGIEQTFLDDYAPYIKDRYGISQPFAPEEDKCRK